MPWHYMAKKDVTTCEKLRRVGSEQRLADIRMGEPAARKGVASYDEKLVVERTTQGSETSKYLEEKKEKSIS